jgi:prepilin-type processing-associated H-X9-DG protein
VLRQSASALAHHEWQIQRWRAQYEREVVCIAVVITSVRARHLHRDLNVARADGHAAVRARAEQVRLIVAIRRREVADVDRATQHGLIAIEKINAHLRCIVIRREASKMARHLVHAIQLRQQHHTLLLVRIRARDQRHAWLRPARMVMLASY